MSSTQKPFLETNHNASILTDDVGSRMAMSSQNSSWFTIPRVAYRPVDSENVFNSQLLAGNMEPMETNLDGENITPDEVWLTTLVTLYINL